MKMRLLHSSLHRVFSSEVSSESRGISFDDLHCYERLIHTGVKLQEKIRSDQSASVRCTSVACGIFQFFCHQMRLLTHLAWRTLPLNSPLLCCPAVHSIDSADRGQHSDSHVVCSSEQRGTGAGRELEKENCLRH